MKLDSRAVHAGRELKPRDPLAPPIVQTAVYVYDDLDDYDAVARGERPGHVYARNSNENTQWLERAVAELEGAEAAVATGSGPEGRVPRRFFSNPPSRGASLFATASTSGEER